MAENSRPVEVAPAVGLQLIERWESLRLKVYQDSIGIWTIGYGSIRGLDGRRLTAMSPSITEKEAVLLLIRDSKIALTGVQILIDRQLTDNQLGALVCWTYNLGETNLKISTLRQVINRGEVGRIEEEWLKWNKAGGKVLKGLTSRRESEYAVFSA